MNVTNLLIKLKLVIHQFAPKIHAVASEAKDIVQNVSQTAQHTLAIGTAAAGTSTWFGWIPSNIGTLATISGMLLSLTLVGRNWTGWANERKLGKLNLEKTALEVEDLKLRQQSSEKLFMHLVKDEGNGEKRRITDNPLLKKDL